MIGVQIGEAVPFALRKRSEVCMRFRDIVRRPPSEALNQRAEFIDVGGEFDGTRASHLLVDFRSSLEPLRPLDWSPEREPFQKHAWNGNGSGLGKEFAHVEAEAIAQMANHVVGGHGTPAALAGWPD